ncbi:MULTISPECIES: TonB-dependent receptor [unclassified Sphingobium]|uniref:TonB-dependent receptor n=1 Tax=unclassified Sphingobium TaxID=2611147 RepID=UPI002223F1CA|nr:MULTISPECIES: TonB-dependent receptor [unclassified Sphingobium]MCW2370276.1 iron complex outermembrane receptor protein [Sphingobium sp. B11D3D]MCW2411419.1 iron complex outermembrane receptor protein [Sphingobium sp. B8D3D]MCW2416288.1 iron complex outermembrane receptor protein [Sphingobium sp. B8D3A]
MKRTFGKLSASALALCIAQTGHAQVTEADGASERGTGIADIVVTATRRATNLQDTPIAISALPADALMEQGLTNVAEMSRVVPNVSFEKSQAAFGPGMSAFIRGIGSSETNLSGEAGVAFYIDDVYYPLVFGSMFDLLDLERVEVLRGPQGTLFGRNSLAGAVNLTTRRPVLGEASGYGEFTVGSYDRREMRAGINLPLGSTMSLSVSGLVKKMTGYQRQLDFRCEMIRRGTPQLAGLFPTADAGLLNNSDINPPKDCTIGHLGGEDVQAIRGQIYWEPTPRLKITAALDYLQDNSEAAMDSVVAINPAVAAGRSAVSTLFNRWTAPGGPTFAYDSRFITGDPYTTFATFADPIAAGTAIPGNTFYNGSPFRGGITHPSNVPQTNWGGNARIEYEISDNIDVVGIVGYRRYDGVFGFDVDGSPVAMENNRNDVFQDDWTGEIRLIGKTGWADWVVGAFYYWADGEQRFSGTSPFNNTQRYLWSRYTPESKAVFANATLRPFGDRFGLTLGGRFSKDKKGVDYRSVLDGTTATSTQFTISPTGQTVFNFDIKDERFDWKVGADYKLSERTMIYASVATGARLPGFNARPLQPSQVAQYPGDETQSYELGVKTDLFDRMLRINAAAFYTDYKTRPTGVSGQEYQLGANGQPAPGGFLEIPNPVNPAFTTCRPLTSAEIAANTPGFACIGRTFYQNTPGKVKGFELELDFRPVEGLAVGGSIGYHKFSSADLDARPAGQNRRPVAIPELKANAGIQYEVDAPALQGTVTPRVDWFYTGSQVYSPDRVEYNQDGYSLVNARLTYANKEYDFSIAAGVTNVFKQFYWRNYFIYQAIGYPQINGQPGAPREWYLTLNKRF